ncbi:MAG: hypothetical protein IJS61_05225 [Firmicutes bacterium]|nr:hypothetical protein [Bacillota bacterium]
MKMELGTISERDKALLIIVGAIAFVVLVLRFVIAPYNDKITKLTAERKESNDNYEAMQMKITEYTGSAFETKLATAKEKIEKEDYLLKLNHNNELTFNEIPGHEKLTSDVGLERLLEELAKQDNRILYYLSEEKVTAKAPTPFGINHEVLYYPTRNALAIIDEEQRNIYNAEIAASTDSKVEMTTVSLPTSESTAEGEEGGEGSSDVAPATSGKPSKEELEEYKIPCLTATAAVTLGEDKVRDFVSYVGKINELNKSIVVNRMAITEYEDNFGNKSASGQIDFDLYFTH